MYCVLEIMNGLREGMNKKIKSEDKVLHCKGEVRNFIMTSLVTPCAEDGFFGRLEVDINRFIHNFQPLAHNDFQLLSSVI